MRKRIFTWLICLCLLGTCLPAAALAEEIDKDTVSESDENTFHVSTPDELAGAISKINQAENGEFVIRLEADIVLAGSPAGQCLITKNTATILGNGHKITYNSETSGAGSKWTIGCKGGVLNLGKADGPAAENKLTITANNDINHADPLIKVLGGGTVNMYDGVVLTGNICTSSDAGGVEIQYGTFNMYGGTISDCQALYSLGGGVRVYSSGGQATFNMYGGIIERNKALKGSYSGPYYAHGGGVCVMGANAAYNMSGGTVQDNEASFYGGGICSYAGKVTITGGTVKGNISGAGESDNKGYGGGICNYYGDMTVKNCVIDGNKALNGGGICSYAVNYSSTYPGEMIVENCVIQNNEASEAGGIFAVFSSGVEIKECEIVNNVSQDGGGGVYAYKSDAGIFDSSIESNGAVVGGGIIMESSEVSVVDTLIKGNTVCGENAVAGGIYFDNDGLSLSGKVIVQENKLVQESGQIDNNIYFMYAEDPGSGNIFYQTVRIDGVLAGSQIGVTEQGIMEGREASPAFTTGYDSHNTDIHPREYFTSDDPGYIVLYSKDDAREARLGKAVSVTYEWAGELKPEDVQIPEADTIEEGTEYTAREQEKTAENYIFDGWYTDEKCTERYTDGTVLNDNIVLYGQWLMKTTPVIPAAGAYKVEHYKENADGTYSLAETEFPLYGEIGKTVTAQIKDYEHYHVNNENHYNIMSGIITAPVIEEGKAPQVLTLRIYYDLDMLTVSYDLNGGTGAGETDYRDEIVKYGAVITVKSAPVREGYIFTGWSGQNIYLPGESVTVSNDMTLVAQWKEITSADPDTPQTGDGTNMAVMTIAAVAVVLSAAGTVILDRKRRVK